jgi:dihydrofolate synthase/folylpolyglutamate synthase
MPKTASNKSPRSTKEAAPKARKPKLEPDRSRIRNYRSAINYLNTRTNYEKMVRVGYNHTNFNLSRMQRLATALGNPHREFKSIHIAGTKGKGSTAHMIAAMLRKAGFKVGLYTSPHFLSICERIVVDNEQVTEVEFGRLIARVAPVVDKIASDGVTFFEIITAAAFLHFVDKGVDIAVVETGLGGRLDSTNILKPEVCAITNISYDHMAQLGNTLEAIAEEKAGIFKPGVPIVTCEQTAGVTRVLREHAGKLGSDINVVGDDITFSYRFESSRVTGPHTRVCMATPTTRLDHVRVPLLGEHQAHNCGIALGVIDVLRKQGTDISEQDAIDGLADVTVRGRLEIIRTQPNTVVDGAHNAASIAALMRAIGQNIPYDSMVIIFGCSTDKDITGMLKELQLGADKVIFTSTGPTRSADPHELLQRFQEKSNKMAMVEPELKDAFRVATTCVSRDDLICITGSVYLVGRAMRELAAPVDQPTA